MRRLLMIALSCAVSFKLSKLWMRLQSTKLEHNQAHSHFTPPMKFAPTQSHEHLDRPLSIASQMALGLANHPRLASSLTDSHLNAFLVVEQLKSSGQVTNSDLIVSLNSLDAPPTKVEETLAISFTRHFARFSLNQSANGKKHLILFSRNGVKRWPEVER